MKRLLLVLSIVCLSPISAWILSAVASEREKDLDAPDWKAVISEAQKRCSNWLPERLLHYSYLCSYDVKLYGNSGDNIANYNVRHPYTRGISFDPIAEWLIYGSEAPLLIDRQDRYISMLYKVETLTNASFLPTSLSLWHWETGNPIHDYYVALILDSNTFDLRHIIAFESKDNFLTPALWYVLHYGPDTMLVKIESFLPESYMPYAIKDFGVQLLSTIWGEGKFRKSSYYIVIWVSGLGFFESFNVEASDGPVLRVKIENISVEPLPLRNPDDPEIIQTIRRNVYNGERRF